jgi:hypothetical protein
VAGRINWRAVLTACAAFERARRASRGGRVGRRLQRQADALEAQLRARLTPARATRPRGRLNTPDQSNGARR